MACCYNPFTKAWWNSRLRVVPAVIAFLVLGVCFFGSPFWVPIQVGVSKSDIVAFVIAAAVALVVGLLVILLTFVACHKTALNQRLYKKYCGIYFFYFVTLAGSVHIYAALMNSLVSFPWAVLFTVIELFVVCTSLSTLCGSKLSPFVHLFL